MHSLKYFYAVIFLVGMFSCSEESVQAPSDILPQSKIEDVLVSMNLSNSLINFNNVSKPVDKRDITFNVFAENNVKREDYYKAMEWYSSHPEKMKEVYEHVMEKLTLMKSSK